MTHHPPRILAIDPGTKHIGVAVLERGDLVHRAVEDVKPRRSPHETLRIARRIVLRLLRDFQPATIVYERAFFSNNRNSALLNVFVDEVRDLAKRRGIPAVGFAPSSVKKAITGSGGAGKQAVANAVVARFPELSVFLNQDRKSKDRYYSNMFDAVALAIVARDRGAPFRAARRRDDQRRALRSR